MKKPKALILFSGGLDSRLVVELLQKQNIKIELIHFQLPFGGCCTKPEKIISYAKSKKLKLHLINLSQPPYLKQYLKIIKTPEHGYGTALNPCRDCKIYFLKQSKKLAKKLDIDIIATGEVLSQRPMSQQKHQLKLIETKAGLSNKILRPLSAKLLPETIYEKNKLVNRNILLNIKGRNRKSQLELAKKYKIKFPSPGGGCLLCEKQYTIKLKDLLDNKPISKIKPEHIKSLSLGRHFRNPKTNDKIILGRDYKENQTIETLNKTLKQNIQIPKTIPGPTAIFENKKDLQLTKDLINAYSKNADPKLREKFEKMRVK